VSNQPFPQQKTIIELSEISLSGQVRLMEMAYSRLRFGINAMPFISLLFVWYYSLNSHDYRVVIWAALYWLLFFYAWKVYRHYKQESHLIEDATMLQIWMPKIHLQAILHGLTMTLFMVLVKDTATLELKYLYTLTVAAIIAGNATHQSPMISIFRRFLACGWHLNVLLMPWTFANHWQFIMPLSAIYSLGMHKYSLSSHRFFLQLIWLEEEGARLVERYKAAKEEVEAALKAKNQFLTTASHDLRQPVHAMGFLIESILRRNKDPAIDHALNDLKLSVRSVTQMFNSLLDLSKIELGSVKVHLETVSLYPLIEDIVTVFSEEAHARQLDLRIGKTFPNASAVADSLLLRQTVVNLVQNALRYTQSGGVLIGVRKREHTWQIEVWDTGVGVALPDQNKIYSPFYRNEHAWHLNSAGHGLGLAVVARCVELMGAHHGFASREGQGSKFWLRLPRAKHVQEDLVTIPHDVPMQLDDRPPLLAGTCLVVDDDPQVCKAWNAMLSAWGIEVKCAASAKEAFSVLDEGFVPQAILCDQRLRAGENGYELLQAILDRCPIAHGAMVSGEFNSPELLQAEEEGYLVLHKPLEPEVLYAILDRWLKQVDSPVIFRSD
jgi:signal transduction histidine kinase/CheY-like chemotaxis protein